MHGFDMQSFECAPIFFLAVPQDDQPGDHVGPRPLALRPPRLTIHLLQVQVSSPKLLIGEIIGRNYLEHGI